MTEKVELKLITETDKYYEIEYPDGKIRKAFKIDTSKMDEWHKDSILKVAKAFDDVRIKEIIRWLEKIINDVPTVETYLDIVTDLSEYLRECYDVVGRPNLFHYPIKYIDPDTYGRADGLMKRVTQLHSDMLEVVMEMAAMGKLESVDRLNKSYHKYTIIVPSDPKSYAGDHLDAAIRTFDLLADIDLSCDKIKTEIT